MMATRSEPPTCDCGRRAMLSSGHEVYPHRPELARKKLWVCRPCMSWVACHEGTTEALGTLADAATRKARRQAKAALEALRIHPGRRRGPAWVARRMGRESLNIAELSADECREVVRICEEER